MSSSVNVSKGWYSRGYLPHYDQINRLQSITFRLADSLPKKKTERLEATLQLADLSKSIAEIRCYEQIEKWLDSGMGCCVLKHFSVAQVMEETLLKFDAEKYRLIAWCIMPNHVHVLIQATQELSCIVQSWKSYTARWIISRKDELGVNIPDGKVWMREYWDRYIRNTEHLQNVVHYIHNNPVKAGLCGKADEWRWSSARSTHFGNAEPQLGSGTYEIF